MLGLCYTLLDEGLQDSDFLDRYCTGFDVFATYLHGTEDGCTKSADWAADICGLPAEDIRTSAPDGRNTHDDFTQLVTNPPGAWRAAYVGRYRAGRHARTDRPAWWRDRDWLFCC